MSLSTWEKEFYPIKKLPNGLLTATRHSLRKWTGALPENLQKHGCYKLANKNMITDGESVFSFTNITCALCLSSHVPNCSKCPLNRRTKSCSNNGPYGEFIYKDDPRPVIRALKKTLTELEGRLEGRKRR